MALQDFAEVVMSTLTIFYSEAWSLSEQKIIMEMYLSVGYRLKLS
jgi:hypothetical protein